VTAFLASVRSVAEARIALAGGADIVDLKDPRRGALAALTPEIVTAIRAAIPGHTPVSATTGDIDESFDRQCARARNWHGAGVDVVKMACPAHWKAAWPRIDSMRALTADGVTVVAVFAADAGGASRAVIAELARAGVRGALIDTLDKRGGSLRARMSRADITVFVECAREHGLWAGLAGSLGLADIEPLLELQPDFLGFRGALCAGAARDGDIDPDTVRRVRDRIPAAPRSWLNRVSPRIVDGGWAHEMA
jgi:dihydroneopterin aldolase